MIHFKVWQQWDYLFRFHKRYLGTYEGVVLMMRREGYVRSDIVQRVPKRAKTPTVQVSYNEQKSWSAGAPYEWAKPLYPRDLVMQIKFRTSPHLPPAKLTVP